MTTAFASLVFVAACAWCAHRLAYGRSAWEFCAPLPVLLGSWVGLWVLREPTAARALLAFLLADGAILVLGVLGVVRLLGAVETGAGADDGNGGSGLAHDPDLPEPWGPSGAVRPTQSGSRPISARRSPGAMRARARSSSARSGPVRS